MLCKLSGRRGLSTRQQHQMFCVKKRCALHLGEKETNECYGINKVSLPIGIHHFIEATQLQQVLAIVFCYVNILKFGTAQADTRRLFHQTISTNQMRT